MTTSLACLLVAVTLPFVWTGTTALFRKKQLGTLDNHHPREQARQLTGLGARADAAQANGWEALAIFGPAVILAHWAAPGSPWVGLLAVIWVVARIAHGVFYLANVPPARTAIFGISLLCSVGLLLIGTGVIPAA